MRPEILDRNGRLSKYVKGAIKDMKGNLIGLILTTNTHLTIEFFAKISVCIIIDKKTQEISLEVEEFVKDPKFLLQAVCEKCT